MAGGETSAQGPCKPGPVSLRFNLTTVGSNSHARVSVTLPLNNKGPFGSHRTFHACGGGEHGAARQVARPRGPKHLRLTGVFDGSVEVADAL